MSKKSASASRLFRSNHWLVRFKTPSPRKQAGRFFVSFRRPSFELDSIGRIHLISEIMRNSLIQISSFLLILGTGILDLRSQEPAMETQLIKVGGDFLSAAPDNPHIGSNTPISDMPSEDYSPNSRWNKVKRSGSMLSVQQILESQGIPFPPGATAMLHRASRTLTVRNTRANLDLIIALSQESERERPSTITFTAHLIQAPGDLLRLLASKSAQRTDITPDLQRLLLESNKAENTIKVLHTAYFDAKSGQACSFESISEHEHATGLSSEKGSVALETEMQPLGFRLKIDPILNLDGKTLDLNIETEHNLLWDIQSKQNDPVIVHAGSLGRPEAPFQIAQLSTSLEMQSGQTRLLGTWPAKGDPTLRDKDLSQAILLTSCVLTQDSLHETHSSLPELPTDPHAMVQHTFEIEPGFLSISPSTTSEDLLRALEDHGLKLPLGSQVNVEGQKLVVRTTAEWMPVTEAWLERYPNTFPKSAHFTLEVFRGPAAQIRSIILSAAALTDQTAPIAKLHEAVARREVESKFLTAAATSQNQRVEFSSVLKKHIISELSWEKGQPPHLNTEHHHSGFRLEVDPAFSSDGRLIEINYEFEYAQNPPTLWREELAIPGRALPYVRPVNEFHLSHINSSTALSEGHSKIIGAWHPVGRGGRTIGDMQEIAILTCHVVAHVPRATTTLKGQTDPKPEVSFPQMTTRMFSIAPDFFNQPSAQDSESTSPSREENHRPKSPQETLEAFGITFPNGASVTVSKVSTERLIVTNTHENLDLIETLLSCSIKNRIRTQGIQLHIVEIARKAISTQLSEAADQEDHSRFLRSLLGSIETRQATSISSLSAVLKNGQSATLEQGINVPTLVSLKANNSGPSEIVQEPIKVGTKLEIESTNTADDNSLQFHYVVVAQFGGGVTNLNHGQAKLPPESTGESIPSAHAQATRLKDTRKKLPQQFRKGMEILHCLTHSLKLQASLNAQVHSLLPALGSQIALLIIRASALLLKSAQRLSCNQFDINQTLRVKPIAQRAPFEDLSFDPVYEELVASSLQKAGDFWRNEYLPIKDAIASGPFGDGRVVESSVI